MEEFFQNTRLSSVKKLTDNEVNDLNGLINKEQGIVEVAYSDLMISLVFNPYLITEDEIVKLVENVGVEIKTTGERKGFFKRWVHDLAYQNKKNLGSQRLDCCDMNH